MKVCDICMQEINDSQNSFICDFTIKDSGTSETKIFVQFDVCNNCLNKFVFYKTKPAISKKICEALSAIG